MVTAARARRLIRALGLFANRKHKAKALRCKMSQFAPRDSEWDMNAKARGKELEFNERAAMRKAVR